MEYILATIATTADSVASVASGVNWARAQFAMTIAFHFLFVPITLGMSVLVGIMETMYYKTGKKEWLDATKFWQKLLAINIAIGIATGIIHEFEFGTNWSNYSWVMGDVFGAPLAVEGIFAFFMEASFGVVSIFGWRRVGKKFHLFSTWMLAIGTNLSGLWIIVANSFMQHPTGYKLSIETARAEMTDFSHVALQPKVIDTFLHQMSSAYMLSATFMITISAYYILRAKHIAFAKRSIAVAISFALINAYFLFLLGDMQAATVTNMQPTKMAAAEGLFTGKESAPIVVGILNPSKKIGDTEKTEVWGIPLPNLLSLLGKHSFDAFIPGINDLVYGNEKYGILPAKELMRRGKLAINAMYAYHAAKKDKNKEEMNKQKEIFEKYSKYFGYGHLDKPEQIIPSIPTIFYSFHIMVGIGSFFMIFFVIMYIKVRKNTILNSKLYLRISYTTLWMSYIATMMGWVMAEVGRQPWTVFGVLPTSKSATPIHLGNVQATFFIFLTLFVILGFAEIKMIIKQIKLGPDNH